jgi:hypothetical protein
MKKWVAEADKIGASLYLLVSVLRTESIRRQYGPILKYKATFNYELPAELSGEEAERAN